MLSGLLTERLEKMRIHVPIEREETLVLGLIATRELSVSPLLRERLPEPMKASLHLIQPFSGTSRHEQRVVVLQLVHAERLDQAASRLFAHRVDHIASGLQSSASHELVIKSGFLLLHLFQHVFGDRLVGSLFERVHQVLHLVEIAEDQRAERVAQRLHALQQRSDLHIEGENRSDTFDLVVFLEERAQLENGSQAARGLDVLMRALDFFGSVQRGDKPA